MPVSVRVSPQVPKSRFKLRSGCMILIAISVSHLQSENYLVFNQDLRTKNIPGNTRLNHGTLRNESYWIIPNLPIYSFLNLPESFWIILKHSKMNLYKFFLNRYETFWIILNQSESFWKFPNHFESSCIFPNYSESFRIFSNHWIFPNHSDSFGIFLNHFNLPDSFWIFLNLSESF